MHRVYSTIKKEKRKKKQVTINNQNSLVFMLDGFVMSSNKHVSKHQPLQRRVHEYMTQEHKRVWDNIIIAQNFYEVNYNKLITYLTQNGGYIIHYKRKNATPFLWLVFSHWNAQKPTHWQREFNVTEQWT